MMGNNFSFIIVAILAFLVGFEISRSLRALRRYLVSIVLEQRRTALELKSLKKNVAATAPKPEDTSGAVVRPDPVRTSVIDLSEDTGPVMPMSPRGVALEEHRRSQS